jgi:transketolase
VSSDVQNFYGSKGREGDAMQSKWTELFTAYANEYPELASEYERRMEGRMPENWKEKLPSYNAAQVYIFKYICLFSYSSSRHYLFFFAKETKAVATRARSEEVLNSLATSFEELIGGSADLTPSNLTALKVI